MAAGRSSIENASGEVLGAAPVHDSDLGQSGSNLFLGTCRSLIASAVLLAIRTTLLE